MHSVAYDKKTQVYQDAHSHVNRLSFLLLLLPDICALANCLTYPNEKQTLFCTRGTMVEDSELVAMHSTASESDSTATN